MNAIIKKPSAWIPIAFSVVLLAIMLIGILRSGPPVREADEGTGAHIFQIWLIVEVLMITFFAVKWLPQRPGDALLILTIQIAAVLAACAPVFVFKL